MMSPEFDAEFDVQYRFAMVGYHQLLAGLFDFAEIFQRMQLELGF